MIPKDIYGTILKREYATFWIQFFKRNAQNNLKANGLLLSYIDAVA